MNLVINTVALPVSRKGDRRSDLLLSALQIFSFYHIAPLFPAL
ncbi:MAG: hypothetical protein NTW21_44610 [Verrucomicrobia bacterium]|nr:hypothetical protein [Verrucomicrobiota bacterium]